MLANNFINMQDIYKREHFMELSIHEKIEILFVNQTLFDKIDEIREENCNFFHSFFSKDSREFCPSTFTTLLKSVTEVWQMEQLFQYIEECNDDVEFNMDHLLSLFILHSRLNGKFDLENWLEFNFSLKMKNKENFSKFVYVLAKFVNVSLLNENILNWLHKKTAYMNLNEELLKSIDFRLLIIVWKKFGSSAIFSSLDHPTITTEILDVLHT